MKPIEFFEQQPAHPVPMDLLLLKTFGVEYYEWEPETLLREIRTEFSATPSSVNFDCIQAVRTVHTSNRFLRDWFVFEKIVMGLNSEPVIFYIGQKPSLGQVMAAVDAINGPIGGGPNLRRVEFEEPVKRYIAAVVVADGASPVPESLAFVREYVPKAPPNSNADDDEAYRRSRLELMYNQLKFVEELTHK